MKQVFQICLLVFLGNLACQKHATSSTGNSAAGNGSDAVGTLTSSDSTQATMDTTLGPLISKPKPKVKESANYQGPFPKFYQQCITLPNKFGDSSSSSGNLTANQTTISALRSIYAKNINDPTPCADAAKNLSTLTVMNLFSMSLSDITALSEFTSIQALDLSNNGIKDISPLKSLTGLQSIKLANNPVYDCTPLQPISNLQILDLSGTNCLRLDMFLPSLQSLLSLNLANITVKFKAVLPLIAVSKEASATQTATIDQVSCDQYGGIFDEEQDPIQNISVPYCSLQFTSIAALKNNTSIQTLFLDSNPIKDLSPLLTMTNLQKVSLINSEYADDQLASNLTKNKVSVSK